MPDPELTVPTCVGATCSVTLGRDLSSATPGKLLAVVNHDDSLACEDGTGLEVNRCLPAPDLSEAAVPADVDNANMIRKTPEECGLIVLAPLAINLGAGIRVNVPTVVDNVSGISKALNYSNQDTVDHLVTVHSQLAFAAQPQNDVDPMHAQGGPQTISDIAQLCGDLTVERIYAVDFDLNDDNQRVHHRTTEVDQWIVPAGGTLQATWRCRCVQSLNADTTAANFNGFIVIYQTMRVEQVRIS